MLLCLTLTVHAQSKLIDAIKLGDLSAAQNAVSKGDKEFNTTPQVF